MNPPDKHLPVDGIDMLRQLVEELWVEAAPQLDTLNHYQSNRLLLIRDELLELEEPDEVARYLVALARIFEAINVSEDVVISIYQFALQCDSRCYPALIESIRIFSRFGRWSMVLKLLKLKSALGTNVERRQALYEMAHIYLDFYRSESGFAWAIDALKKIEQGEVEPATDLWFTITSVGTSGFDESRLQRVLDWLSTVGDGPFRAAVVRLGLDHAVLTGDLHGILTRLRERAVVGSQRVVAQLSAMLIQKRVPSCLAQPSELTERERLSMGSLNALLFHWGYFDEIPPLEVPQTWVIGWLFSRGVVSDADIDRAFQYTQQDDELGAIVALIALVRQPNDGLLTPIQTHHLWQRSPLLGQMKIMRTLWSLGNLEQLQDTLTVMEENSASSIPQAFISFRRAEVFEAQGHLGKALTIYENLFADSPHDWFLWVSIARIRLKRGGPFSTDVMRAMPIASVDDDSRGALTLWLELEEAFDDAERWSEIFSQCHEVFGALGITLDELTSRADVVGRLRKCFMEPSLSRHRIRVYPAEKRNEGTPGAHDFVAIEWLVSNAGEQRDSAMVRGLVGQLEDESDAFGVALCALAKHGFGEEETDEILATKLPQQYTTFTAVCERIIRRSRSQLTTDEVGDLGALISRRLQPGLGHELVSLRAWTHVLSSGDWSDSVQIWLELLDKSIGCYSAEVGVVCGFRFLELSLDERKDYLARLHGLLNNHDLKQLVEHWSAIVDGRTSSRAIERASGSRSLDDVLRECVRLYGTRQIEGQSEIAAAGERLGVSGAVRAVLLEHLGKAQEFAGDVLSAFRTFERIEPNERGAITKMWLRGWLARDPNVKLAETLIGQLPDDDLAHHFELQLGRLYWLGGQTASSIRCYTKLMHFDRFRFFALNELGSRLAEVGRRREAAQFYAELAKTTRSRVSRRTLLRDAVEWLENEGTEERLAEVYELLYREYVGEYEYVLRAKKTFINSGQTRIFADFLERIRSFALSSADRVSLELVSLYARTMNQVDQAKRVCGELVERAFHLDDQSLKQLATESTELALWPETVRVYTVLVERFESNPELFEMFAYRLASVQQDKLGELHAARVTLEKIRAFKPQAPEALERLAELSCIDGSSPLDARNALKRAIGQIERGPSRARLMIKLADIEAEDGQREAALRLRHEALSDAPANLVLVGQIVEELVTLGREREAGATLLKYELLNQGEIADTQELSRLRGLLSDSIRESVLPGNRTDDSDGGGLIVRQMIAQTATAVDHSDNERHWLQTLERGRVEDLGVSVGYCQRLREKSLERVLNSPRDRVFEVISWLDSMFSANPAIDDSLPPRPLEALTRFTGDIKHVCWAALPIHTAFRSGESLVLSREIRAFEPGLRRFFVQYFIELSELGGLSFTRWSGDHLFAMLDEFCRYRLGVSSSNDLKRVRLREFYEAVEHQDFERELIEGVHHSVQLLRTIGEEVIGSALELSLFASTSVDTVFRGLELLDESLGRHQRATETLMIELLPRTMLRHQGDYSLMDEAERGQ